MIKFLHYFSNKIRFASILVCVFFQIPQNLFAQHLTSKGTDFWVAFPQQSDDVHKKMVLNLVAEENTTGTVSVGNTTSQFTIKANEVTVVPVPDAAYLTEEELPKSKGIHVVSAKPITVTAHIFIGSGRARSSATMVLPTPALGKEYFTFNLRPQTNEADSFSEFVIVAPEDGTTITIKPTAATTSGKSLPFSVTLAAGEAYLVKSHSDLTGTHVSACKNIAVFSGNSKIKSTCNNSISNFGNLYQQLYPVSTWGKSVVTTPSKTQLRATDLIKIIAGENNTTIRINGAPPVINGVPFAGKLAKGAPFELTMNMASHITSDKPIAIGQFNCGPNFSDPEMLLLSPTEQGITKASFYSLLKDNSQATTTLSSHFVNITMKTENVAGAALQIDGQVPAAPFIPIPGSPYSCTQIDLTPTSKPFTITAGVPFNAVAYGYGPQESYAFVTGAQLNNIGSSISTTSTIAGEPATCEGEEVTFTATLTYQPSSIKWDFGDETGEKIVSDRSSRQSPVYSYTKPGTFTVKLTTINSENNCNIPEVTTFNFKVNEKPEANFTFAQPCLNQATAFTDASTPPAGSIITSRSWDFDDAASGPNNTSIEQNPTHVFSAPGEYEVKLTVTAANTCAKTFSQKVKISPLPKAKFKADPVCEGTKTIFIDESTVAGGKIEKWEWNFGGGKTSDKQNPEFLFTQAGNIPVTLKVTSEAGCTDTKTMEIVVYPKPKAEAGPNVIILRNETTTLNGAGTGTFSWVPATGLSNAAISNPVATPEATTKYKLMVTSPEGCVATDSVTITVLDKLSIPNAFSPNDDGVNDNWVITGLKDYPLATVEIFDRWGNKVFAGGSKSTWDGKRDGNALPMATYYYIVSQNNGNKPVKGQISIIR